MIDSQDLFDSDDLLETGCAAGDEVKLHDPRPYTENAKRTALRIIRRDGVKGLDFNPLFWHVVFAHPIRVKLQGKQR